VGSPVKVLTRGSQEGSGSRGPCRGRREAVIDCLGKQAGSKEGCSDYQLPD